MPVSFGLFSFQDREKAGEKGGGCWVVLEERSRDNGFAGREFGVYPAAV